MGRRHGHRHSDGQQPQPAHHVIRPVPGGVVLAGGRAAPRVGSGGGRRAFSSENVVLQDVCSANSGPRQPSISSPKRVCHPSHQAVARPSHVLHKWLTRDTQETFFWETFPAAEAFCWVALRPRSPKSIQSPPQGQTYSGRGGGRPRHQRPPPRCCARYCRG